jgi:hypothetical protein
VYLIGVYLIKVHLMWWPQKVAKCGIEDSSVLASARCSNGGLESNFVSRSSSQLPFAQHTWYWGQKRNRFHLFGGILGTDLGHLIPELLDQETKSTADFIAIRLRYWNGAISVRQDRTLGAIKHPLYPPSVSPVFQPLLSIVTNGPHFGYYSPVRAGSAIQR